MTTRAFIFSIVSYFCVLGTVGGASPRIFAEDSSSFEPRIFGKTWNVVEFGAIADGSTNNAAAIQAAIDACSEAGGGTVFVPRGEFVSGSIHLKSDVEFYLDRGAVLVGSVRPEDYDAPNYCVQNRAFASDYVKGGHLISCVEQKNVSIVGPGEIDGSGPTFQQDPNGPGLLPKQQIPWRPGQAIFFCECENVRVEDVRIENSPYWTLFLHGCVGVRVRGVSIFARPDAANGDGIDVDCCNRVFISECDIETGDDCITLRANTEPLKTKRACENVVVSNCVLKSPHSGVRIGVGDGIVRDAVFTGLVMRDVRMGINFHSSYSSGSRGVSIENIRFENISMRVASPLVVTLGHAAPETKVRDLYFSGISGAATEPISIEGRPENPVENVAIVDSQFRIADRDFRDKNREPLRSANVESLRFPSDLFLPQK